MAKLPAYRPQLATLVEAPPSSPTVLTELKLDGYRIGAILKTGTVLLETRRNNDWTEQFPTVAAAVKRLVARTAVLDGEVAAVLPSGLTSFQGLQNVGAGTQLVYFVFDLLHLDGEDVAALPLLQRKEKLRALLEKSNAGDILKYVEHVVGDAARVFQEACKLGAEGIIVKNATAPYKAGRNTLWLKVKCVHRQELVIGGYTEPEGSRAGLGALLVGYYDAQGAFIYAGKVGTGKGFTREFLTGLRKQLDAITQAECPFKPKPKGLKQPATHWVAPQTVVEVQFVEWTGDGHLRHPSLLGLRKDKQPRDVVRERPRSSA